VALLALDKDHCKWPVEGGSCGCTKAPGIPYCATHHAIAVQPPNKKPSNWIPGRAALGIGAVKTAEDFLKETA
jgi:hypothetical protein